MIQGYKLECPYCGGELKYYDQVNRMVKIENGNVKCIKMKRFKCKKCFKIHRLIPEEIFPFKQYDAEIIRGVLDGTITNETLGFEDYPSETTIKEWKKEHDKGKLDLYFQNLPLKSV